MKASIIFFFVSISTVAFSQSKAAANIFTPQTAAFEAIDNNDDDGVLLAPSFVGGEQELSMFIMHNLYYPNLAKKNGIEGEVVIAFEVTADGRIKNISVDKSLGHGCDQAALQVVKNMPYWNPATLNGKKVNKKVKLPIQFTLR